MASSTLALSHANHDHSYEVSDQQLIASAKSGNRSAFDELCWRHSQRIQRVTYRITKNREDGEDALQETYLKAFLHLNSFEGCSSFLSWLTRIAINSALIAAGYRKEQVMELLLGIALKTIGNYLDHISPAPIDPAFARISARPCTTSPN